MAPLALLHYGNPFAQTQTLQLGRHDVAANESKQMMNFHRVEYFYKDVSSFFGQPLTSRATAQTSKSPGGASRFQGASSAALEDSLPPITWGSKLPNYETRVWSFRANAGSRRRAPARGRGGKASSKSPTPQAPPLSAGNGTAKDVIESTGGIGQGDMIGRQEEEGEEEEDVEVVEEVEDERAVAQRLLIGQLEAERAARQEVEARLAEKERQVAELAAVSRREAELQKLVAEREEMLRQLDEDRRAAQLQKLQALSEYWGALIFSYPEKVTAGLPFEIFFHRAQSALADKSPPLFITGAFNEWRWNPFRYELSPSKMLPGGAWWSCQVAVPEEAYGVEFVFVSADGTYENNKLSNFNLKVEGGFDEEQFEELLLIERHREAELAAAEEAALLRVAEEEARMAAIEAAKEELTKLAQEEADAARASSAAAYGRAASSMPGVWYTDPPEMTAGRKARIFYNRSWRPLCFAKQMWIHLGHNGWQNGVAVIREMSHISNEGGDWWEVEVTVPEDAFMLNWVLADAPSASAQTWDNNSMLDYCATVGGPLGADRHFAEVAKVALVRLQKEQVEKEKRTADLVVKRGQMKAEMRERTLRKFFEIQSKTLATIPQPPEAGEKATIVYNPAGSALESCPEVYAKGSFNRWSHRKGAFASSKMKLNSAGTHLESSVDVPQDAYVMDLVFSSTPEHREDSRYDNRNGLDYHVPVQGGTVKAPPLHIIHVALEMAPIAKVGGLGDVVTALSRAVQEQGHRVEVLLPKYDCLLYSHIKGLKAVDSFNFEGTKVSVWRGTVEGVSTTFLEPQNGMFWVGCVYGRKDDGARFEFFCRAALAYLIHSNSSPDILHGHDWSSAPLMWQLEEAKAGGQKGLQRTRSIFTIHNLEFGVPQIGRAMAAATLATTVSPTYALEVASHSAISPHLSKFYGIINGIDPDIWDPLGDPYIPVPYTPEEVVQGKAAAKADLQRRLGLEQNPHVPMVGVVSRLTAQKGMHLIRHAIFQSLERGGQVVLLGSAPDPRHQGEFQALAHQLGKSHPSAARLCLSYDEPLSHMIYAACDVILVPSIFEPCGLTQLIALRYGAIPVVRKTGGLNDTVFDVDHDTERAVLAGVEPNGFTFHGADTAGIDYALNRALSKWYEEREWWGQLAARVMQHDWTWNRPALDYLELYYAAKKR